MGNPFGYGSYYGQAGAQQPYSSSPTKTQGFGDMPPPAQGQAPQQPIGYAGAFPIMPDQFGKKQPAPPAPDQISKIPQQPWNDMEFLKRWGSPGQGGSNLGTYQSQGIKGGYFGLQQLPEDTLKQMNLPGLERVNYSGTGWKDVNKPGTGMTAEFMDTNKLFDTIQGINTANPFSGGASQIQDLYNQLQAYKTQYMPGELERIAGKYGVTPDALRAATVPGAPGLVNEGQRLAGYTPPQIQVGPSGGVGSPNINMIPALPIYEQGPQGASALNQYQTYSNMVQQQQDYLQAAYNDLVNRYYQSGAFGLLS